jgi:hypothetical protein
MVHVALAVALMGQSAAGRAGRRVTLSLPQPPVHGETVVLTVQLGAIGHDQVHITTAGGRELGTISGYGLKAGRPAGSYAVPVPADAVTDGHVTVVFSMIEGNTERAATQEEVKDVKITVRRERSGRP